MQNVLRALVIGALVTPLQALAQDQAKIDLGESLYNNYCLTCHGEGLVSSGQTFDLRRLKPGDRARFERSVLQGKGQMPPWRGVLSEEELDQIWAFIRAHANSE